MSEFITNVSDASFDQDVIQAEGPVLVDYWAEWCGPCKAFAPTLGRFAAANPDSVRVMQLDVDEFAGIAGEVGIRSVPTLLVVKNGQVVAAKSGALSGAALAAFVDNAVA
jgi:thioredoxin 1